MHVTTGQLWLSPSDVTSYLGCQHAAALALRVATNQLVGPAQENEQAELLFRKGLEHESAYLRALTAQGLTVTTITLDDLDWQRAANDTLLALQSGVDVVYQGVLLSNRWRGVADFLIRVNTPSALGGWSYEALDTKLARHAKPAYVLQLCFYNGQLARLQVPSQR